MNTNRIFLAEDDAVLSVCLPENDTDYEVLGHVDPFSGYLYIDGRSPIAVPASIASRDALTTWVATKVAK